jgi:hypothetical protein
MSAISSTISSTVEQFAILEDERALRPLIVLAVVVWLFVLPAEFLIGL